MSQLPLEGLRVGVTASRKVEEHTALLERRGAEVVWAPALAVGAGLLDDEDLRAQTDRVLARPIDVFVANTGFGLRAWFAALERWGLVDQVVGTLGKSEILARGPKSFGVLRGHGLRETWSSPREELAELAAHLGGRDLTGRHVVVQEHGQVPHALIDTLRERGAEVTTLTLYRTAAVGDDAPLRALVDEVAAGGVQAVTFTAAPAVSAFVALAEDAGRDDAAAAAFGSDVVACCVGPVTAAAFDVWQIPVVQPERARLAAMITELERVLVRRRGEGSA